MNTKPPPKMSIAYWRRHLQPSHPPRKAVMKAKKRTFSIVKAVKQNARDRVGAPPPERVIPDPKQKAAAQPRHKQTLADLLGKSSTED